MNAARSVLLVLLLLCDAARAAIPPVSAFTPIVEAWVGQRVPFFVELRGRGPFSGSARFALPELPGVLLLALGNPVVSSRQIEGEDLFVQTHEFALFAQRKGELLLPAFAVDFASREGFAGPVREIAASVPALRFTIRRPPGSETSGFLVTTPSLELSETWDPQPGAARVGDVYRRHIVQRALDLPGMALALAPADAPDGVRVYTQAPQTRDRLERGEFLGERRDTLVYVPQRAGRFELPALDYRWWDPQAGTLRTQTLPAVQLEVEPATASLAPARRSAARRVLVAGILAALGAAVLLLAQRRRIARLAATLRARLWPTHAVALRRLLLACARDDAAVAWATFHAWCILRTPPPAAADSALAGALRGLERALYGPPGGTAWQGHELAAALRAFSRRRVRVAKPTALPPLNPAGRDADGGSKRQHRY